jgi:NADH:ubiquinone oxidoreductase subunit K
MTITLDHFLVLSAIIFGIGIFGVLTRRNVLGILMSIELMFNAAALNVVAINHFLHPEGLTGQAFVIFVITLAAAEAVVGLSLVLAVYRNFKSVYAEKLKLLHG